ncbi:hypothetical protein ACJRO7_028911 [Eucalyptus globulus]|uniref:Uncharacterized protein n=1 Tax=Eucalyptus globulus TaxID=34317 RepID=A0ABD3K179_EUCGL
MERSSHRAREERDHRHRGRESDEKRSSRGDDKRHRDSSDHHHRHRDRKSKRGDRESSRDRDRERSHDSRGGDDDERDGGGFRRERSRDLRDEREGSRDRENSKRERDHESRREREGSRDRARRERSHEEYSRGREGSVERRHKRKERERSEEGGIDGEDAVDRVSEAEKKQRRRFEDANGERREEKRERRKFGDKVNQEGLEDGNHLNVNSSVTVDANEVKVKEVGDGRGDGTANGGVSTANGAAPEPPTMTSRTLPSSTLTSTHPFPTKVSSISTTNENKGVSITGSHEVPGKTSTDGTSSAAGKSGSLSLDALAKAKKALQIQKELSEKLKKIPLLNKSAKSVSDGTQAPKEGTDASPWASAKPLSADSMSSSSSLPTADAASSVNPPASGVPTASGLLSAPNYEAVKRAQELAAKMGFRQDPQFAPLINLFPGQLSADLSLPQKPTKAPVLRLDTLGREIDEHGNLVNISKPSNLSTLKVNINKQKKDAFQILKPDLDVDPESNPFFDERMGINKTKLLRPKRMSFQFVEEGKWSKEAEIMKLKSQFGEARAKEQKAKQAQLAKAKSAPDINPNLIEVSERVITKEKPKDMIPEIEWWDLPLLRAGNYGEVIDGIITDDKLKMDKITIYVEHPRPIEPPAEPAPPPPQPLKLTKKEQKKLRTQRRLAREKERQEMIRQGLIEPPKPKVKMSNLMKVLGSEATQDPTRLEKEIRAAAAEREQAHVDRNIARKLTPAERREKKERKLFDDPNTVETIVSVYRVNDLSHKQTRFKVDVNAQENRLTGCAVLSDGINVVVVEGGSKSIKRYGKLMLRRINWAAAVNDEDEEEDDKEDKPVNKCVLVWQGSIAKASFNRFTVHECITEAAARKVFSDAGVGHYWDLAVNFSDDQM